jgi:hypothetical protein
MSFIICIVTLEFICCTKQFVNKLELILLIFWFLRLNENDTINYLLKDLSQFRFYVLISVKLYNRIQQCLQIKKKGRFNTNSKTSAIHPVLIILIIICICIY